MNEVCFVPFYMEVLKDENLSPIDKLVLSIIIDLDNGEKHCYASNNYIGSLVGCCGQSVSNSIKRLEKLGYIRSFWDAKKQERTLYSNSKYLAIKNKYKSKKNMARSVTLNNTAPDDMPVRY